MDAACRSIFCIHAHVYTHMYTPLQNGIKVEWSVQTATECNTLQHFGVSQHCNMEPRWCVVEFYILNIVLNYILFDAVHCCSSAFAATVCVCACVCVCLNVRVCV